MQVIPTRFDVRRETNWLRVERSPRLAISCNNRRTKWVFKKTIHITHPTQWTTIWPAPIFPAQPCYVIRGRNPNFYWYAKFLGKLVIINPPPWSVSKPDQGLIMPSESTYGSDPVWLRRTELIIFLPTRSHFSGQFSTKKRIPGRKRLISSSNNDTPFDYNEVERHWGVCKAKNTVCLYP